MLENKLRRTLLGGALSVVFGAAVLPGLPAVAQDAPYFEGKTITVIIGFSPGGGSDLGGRSIANHLSKHIPGNPEIVVQNMPGAGSVTAANFIYERAPKDGTTLFFGNWYPLSQRMGMEGMRVKYDELTIVGPTRSPGGMVTYMRNDAVPGGYSEPADILKAEDLRVTGVSPTSNVDQRLQLAFRALGVDFIHITGQQGLSAAAQSVRTGEMQASAIALAGYNSSVAENMEQPGIVSPLFYWALQNPDGSTIENPYMPDNVPPFREFYTAAKGEEPSGRYWDALKVVNDLVEYATHTFFGPPGMDAEAAAILERAVKETLADPEYREEAERVSSYAHDWVEPSEAKALLEFGLNVDEDVLKVLEEISNPQSL